MRVQQLWEQRMLPRRRVIPSLTRMYVEHSNGTLLGVQLVYPCTTTQSETHGTAAPEAR